ncbi:hypothetical protein NA57DRAFT_50904 [Rhizodiscina lignyota]|uniref:Flavin reductase like domain-containing protein n=1 Tax=Rhizodiscina lignyota TaxID=1504668 RepID=A0A9P4ITL6_9PEZI|nr:hypothetical protein NA57DRAFT_50904 [Rhizodiscina lignyota]
MSSSIQPTDPVEAFDKEALIKRNPHADWAAVEASREEYDSSKTYKYSKSPNPQWQPGDGASNDEWKQHKMVSINPQDPSRTVTQNYKFIISSVVPRPIAFVSTVSKDGLCQNIAPFSYFNAVSPDPPIYTVSIVGDETKDTLRNCIETGELCISIISDWYLEAANFCAVNTPPQQSEWPLAGLHPRQSTLVKPPHPAEAAFSMECKVHSTVPIYSKNRQNADGSPVRTATLVLCEAVLYHVREDAIDEKTETLKIEVLRPMWRGGGITYGSLFDGFEALRPMAFRHLRETEKVKQILENVE